MSSLALVWSGVLALVVLAWVVWAVREYRRTGKAMWLWMAVLMLVSILSSIRALSRL